jgi:hypothetical protein
MRLVAECQRREIGLSGDGYVEAAGAAALLRKAPKTLRNWRDQSCGPTYRKAAGKSGHVEYSLVEIAAHLRKNISVGDE